MNIKIGGGSKSFGSKGLDFYYILVDGFYLFPDLQLRNYCFESKEYNGHYKTRAAAELVVDKYKTKVFCGDVKTPKETITFSLTLTKNKVELLRDVLSKQKDISLMLIVANALLDAGYSRGN